MKNEIDGAITLYKMTGQKTKFSPYGSSVPIAIHRGRCNLGGSKKVSIKYQLNIHAKHNYKKMYNTYSLLLTF